MDHFPEPLSLTTWDPWKSRPPYLAVTIVLFPLTTYSPAYLLVFPLKDIKHPIETGIRESEERLGLGCLTLTGTWNLPWRSLFARDWDDLRSVAAGTLKAR